MKRNKAIISGLTLILLSAVLCSCGNTEDSPSPAEAVVSSAPVVSTLHSEESTEPTRKDGERFEAVISIEGMEETVGYEHVRNEAAGYEMDFEYESLYRVSDTSGDRFISLYDDPADPWNYLEVTYFDKDIETVITETYDSLLTLYENVVPDHYTLEHAGSCTQLSASSARDHNPIPGSMQTAYFIESGEGCLVATVHCTIESAGGFGVRFSNMLNTLTLIG